MFFRLLQYGWKLIDLYKVAKVLSGCLIVSMGILILKHAHLVTGGTAGLALSMSYLWGAPFSIMFFAVNIPFYILSIMRMGWNFTFSTLFAVTSLSFMTEFNRLVPAFVLPPAIGAIIGGGLIGVGLVIVFSSGSSLGGVNIFSLYLQKRLNWDPGVVNFIIDAIVVISSILSIGLINCLYSILSIAIISGIISHFKGRTLNNSVRSGCRIVLPIEVKVTGFQK